MIQPSVRLWVSAFITIITLAVIIPGTTLIGLSGYNLYKNYLTVSPEENSKELIRTFPDDFPAVLAATDDNTTPQINFRAVSLFSKKTYFDDNIEAPGKQLNLGDGTIIASNVIYSLTAGQGITITGGQTPTISATTPTYTAGDGITIDGATIANDDKGSAQNIFKNIAIAGQNDITADSNIDTLTLIAGTGITLTSNAANDAITISAPPIITGWTTSGANVYLSTVSDNVGIGTASPTAKLEVIGSAIISSNLTLGGNFILSGDIISDITGSGLSLTGTTLGIALTTTGSTGATASNSGLEVSASGLTLLKGCQTGELLKWNDSLSQWECATDTGGTSGIINVEEDDTLISASAGTLDFLGADFILTEAPTGEINVSIDYPNSLIVRSNQNETITGNWTFNNAISAPTALNTINGLIINAGALSGVTGYTQNTGNFTINGSGTISLGTGTNNITIGNGTGTFSLNSNALDISTTGAITGATGITSSGTITFSILSTAGIVLNNASGTLSTTPTIGSSYITDNDITATDLAATLTFADGDLLDLSAINNSSTSEGLRLPQTTNCASATAAGQICWDSDSYTLYVGDGSGNTVLIGGSGGGDITAVGDVTSGDAFTQTAGNDGNTLYFEGTTVDANEIALTAQDPTADITVTIPNIAGVLASLAGTQTFTGTKTFNDITIADTTIAFTGATTTFTTTGAFTLTPGGTITLGDGGDQMSIDTSDWDISTTGVLSGISGITTDGGYTQTGTNTNTLTGATTFQGGTTTNRTLTIDSGTTQNVAHITFTTPADTTGTNISQAVSISPTIGNATGGTNTANIINIDAFTGDAQVTVNALNIGALTGTAATEYAINIGSGWDSILRVNGTEVINGSGQLIAGQITGTLFQTNTDSASPNNIDRGDTLAILGATNGIDTSHTGDTITISLDTTEVQTTTWGQGTDFTWTFDPAGATNPTLAFTNDQITIGAQTLTLSGTTTLTASSLTTLTSSATLGLSATTINIGNGSAATISTPSSNANLSITPHGTGILNLATTNTGAVNIGNGTGTFSLNSNALDISTTGAITGVTGITGARTITGTTSLDIWSNTITNQTSSGIQRGLVLINANDPANAVTESLIAIDNAETTASTVTDAIIITSSGVNGGIIDAIDVSDSNITNALNAGANFITLDGLRFFEGTTGVFTFEDSAGNDFFTITDNGTSGTIAITNTGFLDLSAITHATTALMGLRLPQANTLSNPTSGEGFLAWDADDNILMVYNGSNWENVSGTTLQQAYGNDTDGSDTIILLSSADDSIIVRNPASSGTDSGYILSLDQLNTGAVDGLRVTNAGTGTGATFSLTNTTGTRSAGLRIEQTGAGTTTDGIIIAESAGAIINGITIGTGVGTAIVLQQGESIDNSVNNQINMNLGSTGTLLLTSATSATIANSAGSLILDAAGGTVVINDATIDIANQATDFEIRDNSTTAMTISQATNNYLIINTDDVNTAVTLDLPVAGSTSTTANLFTSNIAKTINIGTGTGADTINIGTGATSADTITMGNTSVATTMTFNSGATTTNAVTFNLNSITTATAFEISLDGITSGTGLLLDDATATGLSSGTMLQIQSVTTDTTAITDGMLAYLDWSPSSTTTKVGDLFRINIGASGNVTNLFNITDNGSSLFAVSETAITSAVPHSFTAQGDVAIAYDMQFTNQTASYIKSNAPLYIEAGEAFEANHLTLRTFNTGQIVIDGTLNGATVVSNTTSSAAGTVTVSGRGLIYYLHDNSGTTNSSYTTTINITGLPSVEGSMAFIRTGCQKGATTGSQTHTCTIQVNGTTISSVATATGTGASTVIENYVAAYINGSWRLIVGSNTSSDTADLAEIYKAESDVDAGELVALTEDEDLKVKRATKNDGTKVLGVTSTEPAILIGDEFGSEQRRIAVALAGRVPVKVKTENGNIKKGDFITISSTPGVGMKATEPGMVVGKALTAYENPDPKAIGTITIFIQNTYYSPIDTQLAKPKDLTPDALSSTAMPYLLVSGLAEISDLTVTGQFLAGNLSVTGMASQGGTDIATLTGPLRLQPDAANNVEIMGGKVIIDTQGNIIADEGTLSIKTVTAQKINIDNTNSQDASLGTATINAWKTRVTITTTAVTQNSQIFLTAKSKTRLPLSVTNIKAGESFTVEIPEDQEEDLVFSWWVVN